MRLTAVLLRYSVRVCVCVCVCVRMSMCVSVCVLVQHAGHVKGSPEITAAQMGGLSLPTLCLWVDTLIFSPNAFILTFGFSTGRAI